MPFDPEDTATETVEDPYPPRRKFFHVTQAKAGFTVFMATVAGATLALTFFSLIAEAKLDSRMLSERDWVDLHYVSDKQETERVKALDEQLQAIRETQVQIATTLEDIRKVEIRGRR